MYAVDTQADRPTRCRTTHPRSIVPIRHRPRPGAPLGPLTLTRTLARALTLTLTLALILALTLTLTLATMLALSGPAGAQGVEPPAIPDFPVPEPAQPEPAGEIDDPLAGSDDANETPDGAISIDIGTAGDEPSQSVLLIVGLAVLSLAPSLVVMLSSFTRIIIVFSLTRNALGLQGIPPNQVLVGLALFLSLFIMAPTLDVVNETALQPYLDGAITQEVAYERATKPVHEFMLSQTRASELELMLSASGEERPELPEDIPLTTLIPAFLLSELKTAFIIGFIIFIPFLIIDIVVASVLMALGMMMLPPVFVSLPFKLLLFVMVGGWSLIVETILASF